MLLGSFRLDSWLPLCRKRKRTPGRMGRKRESWNNYARLLELLVMQEEVYPTSDARSAQAFMLLAGTSGQSVGTFVFHS